ncbi:related to mitochondrial protein [Cephalotrichum gorgonifer]|uniref:MICOS complex subunit n=1 Tax=Cephalotrichum gorgonifer TaxID=2041049 RepID=A0AAE8MXG4_9PEZI|nr:related to mitochondrial protein [Cephalotrichum gorgonifer]
MAARVLLQRSAVAPVTATLILGGFALRPQAVYAEAPSRKPIYDDVDEVIPTPVKSSPSAPAAPSASTPVTAFTPAESTDLTPRRTTATDLLAQQIGKARMFIYHHAVTAEKSINCAVDSAFNLEQSFTNTVASLAPPRESGEKLMPGAVYVLVAAMAGSIVARNRNVLFRAAAPLAFGLGAGWVVLPVTMNNASQLAWKYEQRFPAVASTHTKIRDSIDYGWHFARAHRDVGARIVNEKVTSTREAIEGWVRKGA